MRIKSIVLIALAFSLGSWLLYSGANNWHNNNLLLSEGKPAAAQVLDRTVRSGGKGGTRYYLSVQFQTDAGQSVQRRVRVNKGQYNASDKGATVTLRYLAADPAICAVGEPVPLWRGQLFSAGLLLLSGGIL